VAIDAALYSHSKCYFFDGNRYIRVTRWDTGPGTVDPGYPASISNWGWGGFGANGIDAALHSGTKYYFFKGNQYIRVTRGDTGAGTVDPGYPAPISNWGWGNFGANGIDAALHSGTKCYFFDGDQYIRVTRGDTGPGTVDPGYPAGIAAWGWPKGFGGSPGVPTVRLHAKVLTAPNVSVDTAVQRMRDVYATAGIRVQLVSTENLNLPALNDLDVGTCTSGQTTAEQNSLYANRNNAGADDVVVYFVRSTVPPFNGCAAHPNGLPGAVVAQAATQWTLGHEVGHVLDLNHVNNNDRLMTGNGTANITNPPPDLVSSEIKTMIDSELSQDL
jgi:hypothetical protein